MTWFWIFLALLAGAAGLRYLAHLRSAAHGAPPRVDDDALRRILEHGTISDGRDADDEPLAMTKAARAEDEFWAESWDEPEEYHR